MREKEKEKGEVNNEESRGEPREGREEKGDNKTMRKKRRCKKKIGRGAV
jgi:hypothetical protein